MSNSGGDIDKNVLSECKKKNRKYQEKLYKQFYGFAMSIGLRYSNSREEAKEIVNDSFVKVFSSIDKYNTGMSFKAWMRRIVINTSIDHYRKEAKYNYHLDIEDPSAQELNFEAIDQLDYEDILSLLNDLPEIYRLTFNLYEIEGYSHDEIADVLKITTSSSRVYLMRAKKALRELFHKKFNGGVVTQSENGSFKSGSTILIMNIEEKFDRALTSKIKEMIDQHEPEAYELGAWESFEASSFGSKNPSIRFLWVGLAASFLMAMSLNNLYTVYNDGTVPNAVSHLRFKEHDVREGDILPILESRFIGHQNIDKPLPFEIGNIEDRAVALSSPMESKRRLAPINYSSYIPSALFFPYYILANPMTESGSEERKSCPLLPSKVGVQYSTAFGATDRSQFGWAAGVVAEVPLARNLSVTGGMLYSSKSIERTTSTGEGANTTTRSRFAGIELPLNIKYNVFRRKKKEMAVSAGISALAYSTNPNEKNGLFNGNINHAKFANLALSVEFPVEKQVSVMVEPFMKMSLGKSIDPDSNLAMVGLNLRLNYSLAKLN